MAKETNRLTALTAWVGTVPRRRLVVIAGLVAIAGIAAFGLMRVGSTPKDHSDISSQSRKGMLRYTPTAAEWATLTVQPVAERAFRAEHVTEGKIAVDEDRSTPFALCRPSPLLARPGTRSRRPIAVQIEAADNVQAQNVCHGGDCAEQSEVQLDLAQIRISARDLYEGEPRR